MTQQNKKATAVAIAVAAKREKADAIVRMTAYAGVALVFIVAYMLG